VARFDYDTMVQKALRGVVKEALTEAAEKGLTGAHHYYITFQTNRTDVKMPTSLRDKHPEEITIVLQHQFWDLKVTDTYFSVGLSFNDRQETLEVPYTAILSFLDPSVKFGLQFVPDYNEDETLPSPHDPTKGHKDTSKPPLSNGDNVVTLDQFRKK
jgi:hypothetical protein